MPEQHTRLAVVVSASAELLRIVVPLCDGIEDVFLSFSKESVAIAGVKQDGTQTMQVTRMPVRIDPASMVVERGDAMVSFRFHCLP